MIRKSYTAVVEQNGLWRGKFETEPYESAWASKAIFFIRALEVSDVPGSLQARVQISPDGMRWCDEGVQVPLPAEQGAMTFGRVSHFGGWLRVVGELPRDAQLKVMVYLVLKE